MIKVDMSAIENMANAFPKAFEKIALDAMELAGIAGVNILQDKITSNESIQTGNLRNSVTHTQPKARGSKITMELIVGSAIQLSTINLKTGKAIVDPEQPKTYAEYVDEVKPYSTPSLPLIQKEVKKLGEQAVSIYAQRENS